MGTIDPLLNADAKASNPDGDQRADAVLPEKPSCIRLQALVAAVSAIFGACLTWRAYSVQGGEGAFYAIVGGVVGGLFGREAVLRRLRFPVLGAAVGAIASLTRNQLTTCDGAILGIPLLGALIGLLGGAVIEVILSRRGLRWQSPSPGPTPWYVEKYLEHRKP